MFGMFAQETLNEIMDKCVKSTGPYYDKNAVVGMFTAFVIYESPVGEMEGVDVMYIHVDRVKERSVRSKLERVTGGYFFSVESCNGEYMIHKIPADCYYKNKAAN